MAVLPILAYPDTRLLICSEAVTMVDSTIQQILEDMVETMYASGGIGLSAVQVGIHKRLVVIHTPIHQPDAEKRPLYMINPEIIAASEEYITRTEGCLSFPGKKAAVEVSRPATLTVQYLDYHGNPQTLQAEGWLSTCIQHELDHLNGKLLIEYAEPIHQLIIQEEAKKLTKQKRH